jgi:hypothetical protein
MIVWWAMPSGAAVTGCFEGNDRFVVLVQCRLSSTAGSAAGSDRGGTATGRPQQLTAPESSQPAKATPSAAPPSNGQPSRPPDNGHVAAQPAQPDSRTPALSAAAYAVHRAGNANLAADSSNDQHASQRAARRIGSNNGSDSTSVGQQPQQHGANASGRSGGGNPAPRTPSSALPSRTPLRSAPWCLLLHAYMASGGFMLAFGRADASC